MNPHLQSILSHIQQDKKLSVDEKNALVKSLKDADKELEITAFKLERTEKVKRTTAILLEETIEELEQKRKAIEATYRELEIESSLERVRTVAMSMNKADDMLQVCRIISEQLELLKVKEIRNVQTAIIYEGKGSYLNYEYYPKHDKFFTTEVDFKNHPIQNKFANQMLKGAEALFTESITGKELPEWYAYQKTTNQFADSYLETASSLDYYFFSLGPVVLGMSAYTPLNENEILLFRRFRNVFELAYRRFLDIEKAVAQAREAQIETSLERIRAQAMAMRTPGELTGICEVLYTELHSLGFAEIRNAMINIHDDEKETFVNYDYSNEIGKSINHLTYNIHPLIEKQIKEIRSAEGFSETSYTGKDLEDMITFRKKIGEKDDPRIEQANTLYYYFYSIGTGSIGISTFNKVAGEKLDVLKRFRNVFTLAYRRYTDIALAEAQAREAQIELALERVRARTMAMQHSNELAETAVILFKQVKELGFETWSCGFCTWQKDDQVEVWMGADSGGLLPAMMIPYKIEPTHKNIYEASLTAVPAHSKIWEGKELEAHYHFLKTIPSVEDAIDILESSGLCLPERQCYYVSFFEQGYLLLITKESNDELKDLSLRFAKVFNQTYTRFLDLQKAEAQAREAQIEAAVERVRAQTMAMYRTSDFYNVTSELHAQLTKLQIEGFTGVSIYLVDENDFVTVWDLSSPGNQSLPAGITFSYDANKYPVLGAWVDIWKKLNEDYFLMDFPIDKLWKIAEEIKEIYPPMFPILKEAINSGNFTHQWNPSCRLSNGILSVDLICPPNENTKSIVCKMGGAFNMAYQRFLDIEKAEAQAREAKIEAALEKVRSRSLAMHKSDELNEVVTDLFEKLKELQIPVTAVSITIYNKGTKDMNVYVCGDIGNGLAINNYFLPYINHPIANDLYDVHKKGLDFFVGNYSKEEKDSFYEYVLKLPELKDLPVDIKNMIMQSRSYSIAIAPVKHATINVNDFEGKPLSVNETDIIKRFAKVFDQAYTRFIDLQQAEAQTREAQINLAVERVRARALAMYKSEEILELVFKLKQEMMELDIPNVVAATIHLKESDGNYTMWDLTSMEYSEGKLHQPMVVHYRLENLDPNLFIKKMWDNTAPYFLVVQDQEGFKQTIKFLRDNGRKKEADDSEAYLKNTGIKHAYHPTVPLHNGRMCIDLLEPPPHEIEIILTKMGAAFDLAYKRFEDLKNSEKQLREAQIEASLERVRSKTMAMHNSNDVGESVAALFEELANLGILDTLDRCGIGIMHPKEKMEAWTASKTAAGNAELTIGQIDMKEHSLLIEAYNGWKKNLEKFEYILEGDDKLDYYNVMNNQIGYKLNRDYYSSFSTIVFTNFYFNEGGLYVFSHKNFTPESCIVLLRFAGVFGQTYRRYLDLQRAEASARESQIEAALERVRGKAMAMHSSNDLSIAANTVFTELKMLGVESFRSGVGLLNKHHKRATLYATSSAHGKESLDLVGEVEIVGHESFEKQYEAWLKQEMYVSVLEGAEMNNYYAILMKNFKAAGSTKIEGHVKEFGYYLPFSEGLMYSWSTKPYTDDEIRMLNRFKTIIDLTFRRYIELQRVEENALQALRSASLDRVRAEIASMRNKADLDKITPLIWKELTVLNIPFVRCGVFIMDEIEEQIHTFLSTPDGKAIAAFHLPYSSTPLTDSIDFWRAKKIYQTHWGKDTYAAFADAIASQGTSMNKEQYLSSVPKEGIYLHLLPFMQGMLYVGNTAALSEDMLQLIQSVADAFSTAYARYEDFIKLEEAKKQIENTLIDLQAAQKQLIQSEKMASLGELTAGIAHEIQNPLNFVNNFSEVSTELVDEMNEEIKKGNMEDVQQIAQDLKENLTKINHHGKRAGDIVKGMLQHSRTGSATKEPTDINKLADEYLRLAYHGLRAKDKSFNATMKTDYDKSIGNIDVIPQDIGRVILNLITNAFYAVNEKTLSAFAGLPTGQAGPTAVKYEPTVSISTKKINDKVEIKVTDNGNGIPQKVLDKIFQPFFTTKPTGQGTGLGLSMSYDIVKAHGGELKVKTKEGEGCEFIVVMPLILTT